MRFRTSLPYVGASLLCFAMCTGWMEAQMAVEIAPAQLANESYGPYAGRFLAGGRGFERPLPAGIAMVEADVPWTMSLWYEVGEGGGAGGSVLLAGVGDPAAQSSRMLALVNGRAALRLGAGNQIVGTAAMPRAGWHQIAASFDGQKQHLFADGVEVATGELAGGRVLPKVVLGPVPESTVPAYGPGSDAPRVPIAGFEHFGGSIAGFELTPGALSAKEVKERFGRRPDFSLAAYTEGSPAWPTQKRGPSGYFEPQDPSLMPRSKAAFSKPVAKPLGPARETLAQAGTSRWIVAANWRLTAAPELKGAVTGEQISTAGYDPGAWMAATVPGTVLTTMIDRGVYPDPDFGLNNMAIPETLNKQDYWYRVEFPTPEATHGRRAGLTFNGINYAADVWLNGKELGRVKGAFIRGTFDVSGMLNATGKNVLAVRISPPPHPGVPHEQSIKGGAGDNGGQLCLDGPTFVATEGWDWIPAIRDRNSGIWQDVVLSATDAVTIGDPKVITKLPLPDISSADVTVDVRVRNMGETTASATLTASFEGVSLTKQVQLAPGESVVKLTPAEFPQLRVAQPRLWWPNGYGRPDLYHLKLQIGDGAEISDRKELTFGIREITYELGLFEPSGRIRRVEVDPTIAAERGEQVVDVTHAGMRGTAEGFSATLTAAGMSSPAVKTIAGDPGMNDLVLKVNGVRIAARGGNWGMDDSRKRVTREKLEPYFRLHQMANVNIIRNWVGQNTEETFFELADEYGMMVWNDFWASTQDWNVEPEDPALFLENARDVVKRFRNHPSIVIWCGRNEGVPQPVLNEGLIRTFAELDGTRYYSPSSNRVNLRDSGPYKYEDPRFYYANNRGFSVELGISSMSTLESFRASVAEPDQWPISDAWAYHDWHHGGNGATEPVIQKMEEQFGAATSLEDFERKAQMFNYVDHRAIFEGFNQHLWKPNSGRMLWMTQPAWPSNMWQILSSDYDTQASFYAVQRACESRHVQMDLTNGDIAVINTTREALGGARVRARVFGLDNQLLETREGAVDVPANGMAAPLRLDLGPLMNGDKVVLVKLELADAAGKAISENVYWWAAKDSAYRAMNDLPKTKLDGSASSRRDGSEMEVSLKLTNPGKSAVLAVKATLVSAKTGERILPVYLSDNYVSLLPGENRTITARYPVSAGTGAARFGLRGWNVIESTVAVTSSGR